MIVLRVAMSAAFLSRLESHTPLRLAGSTAESHTPLRLAGRKMIVVRVATSAG
jgi:hypothetical protein